MSRWVIYPHKASYLVCGQELALREKSHRIAFGVRKESEEAKTFLGNLPSSLRVINRHAKFLNVLKQLI